MQFLEILNIELPPDPSPTQMESTYSPDTLILCFIFPALMGVLELKIEKLRKVRKKSITIAFEHFC